MSSLWKANLALACIVGLSSSLPVDAAHAQSSPLGVWLDHTGRGAVEIAPCGQALCGRVVWVKSADDAKGCGRQIIGDAKPIGKSGAHNGWIYSPEKRRRYDVEFTTTADGRLKVVGYAGTKLFSRTMMWKRPASALVRCDASQSPERRAAPVTAATTGNAPAAQGMARGGGAAPATRASAPSEAAPTTAASAAKIKPAASDAPTAPTEPPSAQIEPGKQETSPAANADPAPAPALGDGEADSGASVAAQDEDEPGARVSAILDRIVTRGANGNCKVDLPWVKVRFRCEDD